LREFKRLLTDRRIITLLAGGPFFYAFLFGGVYWNGRTKAVPIVIVDQDHSHLSRQITQALNAAENLHVVGWLNSSDEFLPMLRQESAYACVIFPPNFERDLLAGRQPRIGFIYDGTNPLTTGSALIAVRTIVPTYQVGIERIRLEAAGVPPSTATTVAMPLMPAPRQLFNPTSSYSYYILMGLVCVALQSVTRIGCGIALRIDNSALLSHELGGRAFTQAEVFTSKLAATAAISLPVAYAALALPFVLFGAPFRGSVLLFALLVPINILIQICFGYGYAAICKSPVLSTQLHLFMSVPLFTLSGFTWPYYALPGWLRAVAFCTPLFHMNCLLRKLSLLGAPPQWVAVHLLALAALAAIGVCWAWWAVGKEMAKDPAEPQAD
jgi:ABC-2 type transport system permease protein